MLALYNVWVYDDDIYSAVSDEAEAYTIRACSVCDGDPLAHDI